MVACAGVLLSLCLTDEGRGGAQRLMGASVLVFANKTDVGDCMSNEEIIQVRIQFFTCSWQIFFTFPPSEKFFLEGLS